MRRGYHCIGMRFERRLLRELHVERVLARSRVRRGPVLWLQRDDGLQHNELRREKDMQRGGLPVNWPPTLADGRLAEQPSASCPNPRPNVRHTRLLD